MRKNLVRKLIYVFAVVGPLCFSSMSNATILASDDFSYPDGAIDGQAGGIGWAGGWFGGGEVSSGAAVTLPENHSYRELATWIELTAGSRLYAAFDLSTPVDIPQTYVGLSFFNYMGVEEMFLGKPYFESTFGLDWTGIGGFGSGFSGDSARLVAEFVFGALDTTVNFYINPTGYASVATFSVVSDTASLGSSWRYVRLASGGPNAQIQGSFDNLVLATDRKSVGIPEPTSLLIFLFAPLMMVLRRRRG